MATPFVTTRAATLALLLGFPLVHAFACSSPVRSFEADETGGKGSNEAGSGNRGGQGDRGGTSNAGEAGDVSVHEGTSGAADAGEGGAAGEVGAGGEVGAAGEGGVPGAAGSAGDGGTQGDGGVSSGGAQGTGGVSSGGAQGTGGAPHTGGAANSGGASGSVSTGGVKSSGGSIGSGGTMSSGGSVATGGSGSACVPTGAEICNDGKDNDCNGNIDCLTVTGTFPDLNGAAAGKDVMITVNALPTTGFKFQCRSARGPAVADQVAWTDCPSGANTRIMPRTLTESQDPSKDGLWTTQARALYPNGKTSDFISFTYYMHGSMHNATRCTQRATDAAFFAAGDDVVVRAGTFGNTAVLRSPFIQLGFKPTQSSVFEVGASDGMIKLMSLRRRFVRSADDQLILMTRNYASTRSGTCDAIDVRTHDNSLLPLHEVNHDRFFYDPCDAVVFNKLGAGVCLYVDGSGGVQRRTTHAYVRGTGYSTGADNFFWRKLLDRRASSGGYIHFMPKCTTALCNSGLPNMIFLPDRAQFSYF